MATIVDPPPEQMMHHSRSDALAGKKKSNMEMYHALQASNKGGKREDPLKILDPSSKKLVTVESQRIMAVLDDTICKMRLVTMLPELTENLEKSVWSYLAHLLINELLANNNLIQLRALFNQY